MTRFVPCDNCGHAVAVPGKADDGRLVEFTVRLRLYDMQSPSPDDPISDSAEGYPPDHEGLDVIAGLTNVITESVQAIAQHHVEPLQGLNRDTLARKERGIRPTLSRTGGRGRITLDYDTAASFSDGKRTLRYRARIDLQRVNKETVNAPYSA